MTTIHIIKLLVQAGLLLTSLILCASATALSIRSPSRCFRVSFVLAAIALAIAVMGVWAPVSFWPRMGFSWQFANGWHISFDFRWYFILPLLLAGGTCVLVAWRHQRFHHSA
jgi:hypothetical protein